MRRHRKPSPREADEWPVRISARGETLAAWIRAGLDRSGVQFQFKACPNDDYLFRVQRKDKAAAEQVMRDVRGHVCAPKEPCSIDDVDKQ